MTNAEFLKQNDVKDMNQSEATNLSDKLIADTSRNSPNVNQLINGQNKIYKLHAESMIKRLSSEEKKIKIKELKKIGHEYNDGIHTLLSLETIIPYDFVFYCLLVEDGGIGEHDRN